MREDRGSVGPLSACYKGNQLVISRIEGEGMFKRRLLEMGFTPGIKIRIVKYAPLKDPLEVQIKHSHVSLRVCEADRIFVTLVNVTAGENLGEGVKR